MRKLVKMFEHYKFQSTPPRGGDWATVGYRWPEVNFNPRPLAGATITCTAVVCYVVDFNPRPLAGATRV